jgi:hypothetical protein
MGAKVKVPFPLPSGDTEDRLGEIMSYTEPEEKWADYLLEDGATVRIKQIVLQIIKLDIPDEQGNFIYVTKSQPIVTIVPSIARSE